MKKIFCTMMALVMVLSLSVPALAVDTAEDTTAQVGSMDNFTRFNEYMGQFIDVPADSWYASAIENVYEYSLMVGTSGTTFNPDSTMSVAQMITIAARMRNIYYDDGETFEKQEGDLWYSPYLKYAVANGIVGEDEFTDYNRPATRMEFAVSIFNALPQDAFTPINRVDNNAIPDVKEGDKGCDAAYTLYRAGIMCGTDSSGTMSASAVVSRGQVAVIIDRTVNEEVRSGFILTSDDPDDLYVVPGTEEDVSDADDEKPETPVEDDEESEVPVEDDKKDESVSSGPSVSKPSRPVESVPQYEPGEGYYKGEQLYVGHNMLYVGMTENQLTDVMGTPDTYFESVYEMSWVLFNTDTYDGFLAAGVRDGEVIALVAEGMGWSWNDVTWGDIVEDDDMLVEGALKGYLMGSLLSDSNDGDKAHGVYLFRYDLKSQSEYNFVTLGGESRLVFYLTNAFRVMHGVGDMEWSDLASYTAVDHSQDMADNNYFSHQSLDGKNSGDRMRENGILWQAAGENIAAGYQDAVECVDGWINSAGHRSNMLEGRFTNLGVGAYFNPDSDYVCYWTQDFFG